MDEEIIKFKVLPSLVWLVMVMLVGAQLVSEAIKGVFGLQIAQLALRLTDPVVNILVIIVYFVFFFATWVAAITGRNRISFVLANLFAFICGAGLFSIVYYVAEAINAAIIPEALLLTTGVFFVAMIWQWVTNKDLTSWGFWLFLLLLAAIVLSFAVIFVPNVTPLRVGVDLAVIVIFTLLVAYDTHVARAKRGNGQWMLSVIDFFLDFLNILIRIVYILIEIYSRRS